MEHEHTWEPFYVVTSMTLKYNDLHFCKGCMKFGATDSEGSIQVVYS